LNSDSEEKMKVKNTESPSKNNFNSDSIKPGKRKYHHEASNQPNGGKVFII
jgi:hypothetical protein